MDRERYELLVDRAVMVRALSRLEDYPKMREMIVDELRHVAALAEEILDVLEGSEMEEGL